MSIVHRVTVNLPSDLSAYLAESATENNMSKSTYMRALLLRFMEQQEFLAQLEKLRKTGSNVDAVRQLTVKYLKGELTPSHRESAVRHSAGQSIP